MPEKINEIIEKITRIFALNFTEEELNFIEDISLFKIKHEHSEEFIKEFKKHKQCFAKKGNIKIKLEVEPHFCLGGIRINKYGQTNIKNVYALGECSFGMHGYGRIGGCALGEIIVMAQIIEKK